MISRTTIDKVYELARVEEVIGDFVLLKKSGANFKALSPFSQEKTPSFMVSPSKQIWKDFSSGKGGNVISFVMEHEKFSYPEAIRYLAKRYHIDIEETERTDEEKAKADEQESMHIVAQFAQEYFENTLWNTDEGKSIGLSYFVERGFNEKTIKDFGLGFSPTKADSFTQEAEKQGYKLKYLEETGLTIVSDKGNFDRFKGRVIFPIKNFTGKVIGFGGRILTNNKKVAKYINSPESPIYNKSKSLFGLFKAKTFISKEDICYLVEGYTDVIQFHQLGIQNVVASSGTSLTVEQIRLIKRFTPNITILFDSDAAGINAALRGVDLILEQDMRVRICVFPEGEDPDSFAKKNSLEAVTNFLKENTVDFIQFKTQLLLKDSNNDPIKKADVISSVVESISKIPDSIQQEIYIQECAKIINISQEVLYASLARFTEKNQKEQSYKNKRSNFQESSLKLVKKESTEVSIYDTPFLYERKIIEILLLYGEKKALFKEEYIDEEGKEITQHNERHVWEYIQLGLQEDEIQFAHPEFKELFDTLIDKLQIDNSIDSSRFFDSVSEEISTWISDILVKEEKHRLHNWASKNVEVKTPEDKVAQYTEDTILNTRLRLVDKKIQELKEKTKENADSNEELQDIRQSAIDYTNLKRILAQKLGRTQSTILRL